MNTRHVLYFSFTFILLTTSCFTWTVIGCKDIVVCGDATAGDYNLLLKVRDPSRLGFQVLCIVPKGYQYDFYHPWSGKNIDFTTKHKYIGVATEGDTIPHIIKAGMALSDAGISYGDADSNSGWINPTKNAWDDFDWIRYACQEADTEAEACTLLTSDVVRTMHAPSVSENLFVVGPHEAFVIEADAFRYRTTIINDIYVMSNYPKKLWKTQWLKTLPIAASFDTLVEKEVRRGGRVRLHSLYGIKIIRVGGNEIDIIPIGLYSILRDGLKRTIETIKVDERKTVGDFSVTLLDITNNIAKVKVETVYHAWETAILQHLNPRRGTLTIKDLMQVSRLHREDLEDLRGMCQDVYPYEAAAIYKIPSKNYEWLSSGWFAPNHACSSIYVPFHICNTNIYSQYQNGEAAKLCLDLLTQYRHGFLSPLCNDIEDVLLYESGEAEQLALIALECNRNVSDFLTIIDTGMQEQAYLTQCIWSEIADIQQVSMRENLIEIVKDIWYRNYSKSLEKMHMTVLQLNTISGSHRIQQQIGMIAIDICQCWIEAASSIGKENSKISELFDMGRSFIMNGSYSIGFPLIEKAFIQCDKTMKNIEPEFILNDETENNHDLVVLIIITFFAFLAISLIIGFILITRKKPDF